MDLIFSDCFSRFAICHSPCGDFYLPLADVHPYPYPAPVGGTQSFCALSLDCLGAWDLFQNSPFLEKHMQRAYRQLRPEDTR